MGGYSSVATVISNIASRFTTEAQETKLKNFNAQNSAKFGSSASTLKSAETSVANNLLWSKSNLPGIEEYLKKRTNASASTKAFAAITIVLLALFSTFF